MMDQRTLNIIYICKGNTKYSKNDTIYNGIRKYMAEECDMEPNDYTDYDISCVLWEAMSDYLDHCDKPSFFMWCLKDVMRRHDWDVYHAIAVVFSAYTQVRGNNGEYVNGFDDRIHKLRRKTKMAQWNYTLKWGKPLHEAIEAENVEMVIRCLIACYRELLNKLSDDDKDWKQFDIEEEIFFLESFEEEEDVDGYLERFYDICDDVRAWITIETSERMINYGTYNT